MRLHLAVLPTPSPTPGCCFCFIFSSDLEIAGAPLFFFFSPFFLLLFPFFLLFSPRFLSVHSAPVRARCPPAPEPPAAVKGTFTPPLLALSPLYSYEALIDYCP